MKSKEKDVCVSEKSKKKENFGIYKDEKNGTWSFRVVRDKNYKRTGFKTRALANAARLAFVAAYEKGRLNANELTLNELFSLYLEEGTLSKADGTVKKCKSVYQHHIEPMFGKKKIQNISSGDVNLYLESCYFKGDAYNNYACGYAFGYVESFLKCFYAIFSFAYQKNLIDKERYNEYLVDIAVRIHMPKMKDEDILKDRKGARIFSREEIKKMRQRLSDDPLALAFEIALNCGLRISEVFALTWQDIDFENDILRVDKQLLKIGDNWCFCHPKYVSGYRSIFLNENLKNLLLDEKKNQQNNRQKNSNYIEENSVNDLRLTGSVEVKNIKDFVLVNGCGKNYNPYSFKPWASIFRKELGIEDFTFHALRHTFCSEIAALNCPISELCRMAGHNSIETTMKYYINSTEAGEKAARNAINHIGL